MLGLPAHVSACLFDLDGVLTQTAKVHNAAWAETFDAYLRRRSVETGEPFQPFDPGPDYNRYVDGRPRADGVRTFLASRGITLPEGSPDDPPEADTVNGLGNRKNVVLLQRIEQHGVEAYEGSVRYLEAATAAGLRRAVVSASANCAAVVHAAGLDRCWRHGSTAWSPARTGCAANRPRTRSWTARGCSASNRRRPPSSRTPSPAWPPDGPADSGT